MDNFVTPETAKRLKEDGFPQPATLVFGQIFYKESITGTITPLVADRMADGKEVGQEYTFAPSAIDILQTESLLGYGVSMQFDTTPSGLSWVCAPAEWSMPEMVSAYHETNPAEAAALTWLEINEKR